MLNRKHVIDYLKVYTSFQVNLFHRQTLIVTLMGNNAYLQIHIDERRCYLIIEQKKDKP